jgi:predicted Zn-ribbon and HTH transcriptional regulator
MDERPEGIPGLVEPEPCKKCGTTGKNTDLGGPRKPLCPACEGEGTPVIGACAFRSRVGSEDGVIP